MKTHDDIPPSPVTPAFMMTHVVVEFREGEPGLRKRAIKQDLKSLLQRTIDAYVSKGIYAQEPAIRTAMATLAGDLPRHQRRRVVAGVKGFCAGRPWEISLDFGTVRTPRDTIPA